VKVRVLLPSSGNRRLLPPSLSYPNDSTWHDISSSVTSFCERLFSVCGLLYCRQTQQDGQITEHASL